MVPNSGVGGLIPRPKKASPDILSIILPKSAVTKANILLSKCGITCTTVVLNVELPLSLA